MEKQYKLIACDMDGTFLTADRRILPQNVEMVKECNKRGIIFSIASGRTIGALGPIREKLAGLDYYIIGGNGAHVISGDLKNELYKRTLSIEDCKQIIEFSEAHEAHLMIWCGDHLYVDKLDEVSAEYAKVSFHDIEPYDHSDPIFLHPLENGRSPVEKMFWMDTPERVKMLHDEGRKNLNQSIGIYISGPEFIEIIDRDVNKAHGLKVLCEKLGIDIEDTIAFGDECNDLPMLEAAGLSVAMGNAVPEVKAVCDLVTDTSDNFGVAKCFNKIFGGN